MAESLEFCGLVNRRVFASDGIPGDQSGRLATNQRGSIWSVPDQQVFEPRILGRTARRAATEVIVLEFSRFGDQGRWVVC